jgi:hypothetical protein
VPRNSRIRAVTREARDGRLAVPGTRVLPDGRGSSTSSRPPGSIRRDWRSIVKRPHGYQAQARALIGLAAFLAFALSVTLYFSGDETAGIFVAIWVPSILALGAFLVPSRGQASSIGEGVGR